MYTGNNEPCTIVPYAHGRDVQYNAEYTGGYGSRDTGGLAAGRVRARNPMEPTPCLGRTRRWRARTRRARRQNGFPSSRAPHFAALVRSQSGCGARYNTCTRPVTPIGPPPPPPPPTTFPSAARASASRSPQSADTCRSPSYGVSSVSHTHAGRSQTQTLNTLMVARNAHQSPPCSLRRRVCLADTEVSPMHRYGLFSPFR